MLNHIVLMGRLTRDPELRRTGSGIAVASFTLAVDRDFTAQGAERETDFVDIVAWRNTAEFVSKYFTKGRMAVVSGRLQIRNWQDTALRRVALTSPRPAMPLRSAPRLIPLPRSRVLRRLRPRTSRCLRATTTSFRSNSLPLHPCG